MGDVIKDLFTFCFCFIWQKDWGF